MRNPLLKKTADWVPAEAVKRRDMISGHGDSFRVTRDAYREGDEIVILGPPGVVLRLPIGESISVEHSRFCF